MARRWGASEVQIYFEDGADRTCYGSDSGRGTKEGRWASGFRPEIWDNKNKTQYVPSKSSWSNEGPGGGSGRCPHARLWGSRCRTPGSSRAGCRGVTRWPRQGGRSRLGAHQGPGAPGMVAAQGANDGLGAAYRRDSPSPDVFVEAKPAFPPLPAAGTNHVTVMANDT